MRLSPLLAVVVVVVAAASIFVVAAFVPFAFVFAVAQ